MEDEIISTKLKSSDGLHDWLGAWLATLAWVYLLGLFGWAVCRFAFGDRWWWLFLLNSVVPYLMIPLLPAIVIALLVRRRMLGLATLAAVGLALWFYGGLFLPKNGDAHAVGKSISVMSYNLLWSNPYPERVVATIRASGADLVALQELSPPLAAAIEDGLAADYPYRALGRRSGVQGSGVLSKHPFSSLTWTEPGAWIGAPQLLQVDLQGTPIAVANVHAISVPVGRSMSGSEIEEATREREREVQALAGFAEQQRGPLLVLGDFNMTDQHRSYATVRRVLRDAWRDGGQGFGHTFRADFSVRGFGVAAWLVRIDYVFYSSHWETLGASLGQWDGGSDHRPILATLALKEDE